MDVPFPSQMRKWEEWHKSKKKTRSGLEPFSHPVQLKYFCEIGHLENILLYLLLDVHSSRPLSWRAGIHFPVLIENRWRGGRCVREGSPLLRRSPLLILVPRLRSLPAAFVWKWKPLPHVWSYLFTEITNSWLEWLSGHGSLAILLSFEWFAGIMLFCQISPVGTVNSRSRTRLSLAANRRKMMKWFTLGKVDCVATKSSACCWCFACRQVLVVSEACAQVSHPFYCGLTCVTKTSFPGVPSAKGF